MHRVEGDYSSGLLFLDLHTFEHSSVKVKLIVNEAALRIIGTSISSSAGTIHFL